MGLFDLQSPHQQAHQSSFDTNSLHPSSLFTIVKYRPTLQFLPFLADPLWRKGVMGYLTLKQLSASSPKKWNRLPYIALRTL